MKNCRFSRVAGDAAHVLPPDIVEEIIDIPWQIADWTRTSSNTDNFGNLKQPINLIGFLSTARLLSKEFAAKYKWVVEVHSGSVEHRVTTIVNKIKDHVTRANVMSSKHYSVLYGAVYKMCNTSVVDKNDMISTTLMVVLSTSVTSVDDHEERKRFLKVANNVFNYLHRFQKNPRLESVVSKFL